MAHVVILEDDTTLVKLYQDVIGREGHSVDTFETVEDFLAYFEQQTADLVVADLRIGIMEGYETIPLYRKISDDHNIPMLLISAQMMIYENDCREAGFEHTLMKPFSNRTLADAIKQILN